MIRPAGALTRSTGNIRPTSAGADTAALARMYQQRIPTAAPSPTASRDAAGVLLNPPAPTAPAARPNPFDNLVQRAMSAATKPTNVRQGPRGVTIADVEAVAAAGRVPGWRPGMPIPSAQELANARQPKFAQEDVLANLIGGPIPTAGQRYGGFETGAEAKAQILGQAYNISGAGQLAAEEAKLRGEPYYSEYERLTNPEGYAVQQTLGQNRGITGSSLEFLARQMAGGAPSAQDLYGANMARMNAVRGTGDYVTPQQVADLQEEFQLDRPLTQMEANALKMVSRPALRNLEAGLQTSGALDAQELADAINALSVSDLAQQIAIQEYGYDPGMAAGIFTAEEDLNYQKAIDDAYKAQMMREYPGLNPSDSTADIILKTQGPDALLLYQQQQADAALYGTPTEQLAAEKRDNEIRDALYDESVRQKYGFDPKEVSNIDPQIIRELTLNEDFTELLDEARQKALEGDSALDLAPEYAQKYLDRTKENGTPDNVGAEAMGKIIASFDISYFE